MTVKDIVMKYLIDNDYDGLFSCDGCACLLSDLMPCENNTEQCEPGYKIECKKEDKERCDYIFCISKNKDETECVNKEEFQDEK